jgi:hypothetical protein
VNVGDHVPYVICKQVAVPTAAGDDDPAAAAAAAPVPAPVAPQSQAIADRAYHPDEVMKSGGSLAIDVDWYIAQQVYPPVQRLCEPIEGTDAAMLAECLGLDSSRFTHHTGLASDMKGPDVAERFARAEPLTVQCAHCQAHTRMECTTARRVVLWSAASAFSLSGGRVVADAVGTSLQCSRCHERIGADVIIARMRSEIRRLTQRCALAVPICA